MLFTQVPPALISDVTTKKKKIGKKNQEVNVDRTLQTNLEVQQISPVLPVIAFPGTLCIHTTCLLNLYSHETVSKSFDGLDTVESQ